MESYRDAYLSPTPHAEPQAAGFSSLSPAPHAEPQAAGFSSLSPAPHAEPQAAAAVFPIFFVHLYYCIIIKM